MSEREKIENLLKGELPGWEAQCLMSPIQPAGPYRKLPKTYKKASVVLLIYPDLDKNNALFIRRALHPLDKHSGQISLPGGQLEGDEDYLQAAIREVQEEIGIEKQDFEIIGALTPLYVFVSNFYVQPYVAWMDKPPKITIQESEVSEVLRVDVGLFKEEDSIKRKDLKVRDGIMKNVPYFDLDGNVLWGATAMMLNEFGAVLKNI